MGNAVINNQVIFPQVADTAIRLCRISKPCGFYINNGPYRHLAQCGCRAKYAARFLPIRISNPL